MRRLDRLAWARAPGSSRRYGFWPATGPSAEKPGLAGSNAPPGDDLDLGRGLAQGLGQGATGQRQRGDGDSQNAPGQGSAHPYSETQNGYESSGATRSAHGRACSSCVDSASSVPSSSGRPISWVPSGSPSSLWPSGSEMAGWPVTFMPAV